MIGGFGSALIVGLMGGLEKHYLNTTYMPGVNAAVALYFIFGAFFTSTIECTAYVYGSEIWPNIMGFFPDAADLKDSAVLVVTSFMTSKPTEFAEIGRQLLNNATIFGKRKLVIDLSGNGGGLIPAGWNLFRMIFPEEQIFSASRFRANEASKLLGELLEVFPPSEQSMIRTFENRK